jgi:hypothetical protein
MTFPDAPREDHPADAPSTGGLFIGRRAEAPIGCSQIGRAIKDRSMMVERGRPQVDIGWPCPVHFLTRNDLMFGFLDGDQLPKFIGRRDLALANRFRRCSAPCLGHAFLRR